MTWYERNREEHIANVRKWQKKNKAKVKGYQQTAAFKRYKQQYYQRNKAYILARMKIYHQGENES